MGYRMWGCEELDTTEWLTRIIIAKVGGNRCEPASAWFTNAHRAAVSKSKADPQSLEVERRPRPVG